MGSLFTLASFSIDLTGLMSNAEVMFNSLSPALLPVVGISLGITILLLVIKVVKGAIGSM